VVSPIEDEVNVQSANTIVDEEGAFQHQREREVLSGEGSGSEWEESSSLEFHLEQSVSPKSPLVIPNSPNARAHLSCLEFGVFSNPLLSLPGAELYLPEDDMFITIERGFTR
jgi:hypothetical protein